MCDILERFTNDKHLHGSAKLYFTEGADCLETFADAKSVYIGDNKGFKVLNEKDQIPIERDRCGETQTIKQITTKSNLKFQSVQQDMDAAALKRILSGADLTPITQASNSNLTADDIELPANDESVFQITDSTSGTTNPLINLDSIALSISGTPLIEGTDYFVISKRWGKIRFAPQAAPVIVEVVVATNAFTTTPWKVEGKDSVKGKLEVFYYPKLTTLGEQCEPEVRLEAIITLNFNGEIGFMTEAATEPEITYDVSGKPVITDLRTAA